MRIFALYSTLTLPARRPGTCGHYASRHGHLFDLDQTENAAERHSRRTYLWSIPTYGPQSRSVSPPCLMAPPRPIFGYNLSCFRKDMLAALTVAIVALPLSMAIAVASGVSPERGLYAAVIGGFLVSALGGSRYQIGGPAGAFIALVAATTTKFGLDGLLLTVFISGLMLTLIGLLRLGSLIRYIPHAVTVGFTCGIAVTIFASQLKDLGGFKLPGAEPGRLVP